jgi:hypothetical protein
LSCVTIGSSGARSGAISPTGVPTGRISASVAAGCIATTVSAAVTATVSTTDDYTAATVDVDGWGRGIGVDGRLCVGIDGLGSLLGLVVLWLGWLVLILGRIVRGFRSGGLVVHWLLRRRRRSRFGNGALGESVWVTLQRREVGNGEVVHDLEGHARFFFEGGPGTAHGQHEQVDGPENGDGPEDSVADGVTLAEDASVPIDVIAGDSDDACVNGDDGVGLNDHAVEAQLHPSLADEVAWIFVIFEAADEVAVGGKHGAAVAFRVAELAEDGIADGGGFGREFRF